ncbi:Hypothetical protein A7982_09044 [Minicystis rosea]|nr:Hypothetical protein A7982_09044 [Minicystis rosea]
MIAMGPQAAPNPGPDEPALISRRGRKPLQIQAERARPPA